MTPLPIKLGIKPESRVAILGAPKGFAIRGSTRLAGTFDVIVAFVTKRAALADRIATSRAHMNPACGLWIAFPKRASGVATEVTEHIVRELALPTGLVDNKVCAIDDVYTGLRLVIRKALR
ncbi:MAG TPA: hypothetical protein VGG28_31985 [Kofleriaceae bacterium]